MLIQKLTVISSRALIFWTAVPLLAQLWLAPLAVRSSAPQVNAFVLAAVRVADPDSTASAGGGAPTSFCTPEQRSGLGHGVIRGN